MNVHLTPPSEAAPAWHHRRVTQSAAALAVVLPMAGITAWVAATGDQVTLATMFVAPLAVGGALIFWVLALHLFVCRDELAALGIRREGPGTSLALGTALALGFLALQSVYGSTIAPLLPPRPPVPQIFELLSGVVRSPALLALWLGPVVWIGVALFEELVRVFLLRRLWLVVPGRAGLWTAIVLVSVLIGAGHLYQGVAAMLWIGLKSVAMGAVFLRRGRLLDLVVAHGLYDSIQIVAAVLEIRAATGG